MAKAAIWAETDAEARRPGYLILFAPHAFAPQRQYRPRVPPSLLVFLPISAHFTATPGIPHSPTGLESQQFRMAPPR